MNTVTVFATVMVIATVAAVALRLSSRREVTPSSLWLSQLQQVLPSLLLNEENTR